MDSIPTGDLRLAGDLYSIRLPSLLQLLEEEAFTGWIRFGELGGIGIRDGHVVQAIYRESTGQEALYEYFLETEGTFRAEETDAVDGESLGAVLPTVMNGCRLADEWDRIKDHAPIWSGERPEDLPDALEPLSLDGEQTLAQLTEQSSVLRSSVIDPVLQAVQKRHLKLGEKRAAPVTESQVMPLDESLSLEMSASYAIPAELAKAKEPITEADAPPLPEPSSGGVQKGMVGLALLLLLVPVALLFLGVFFYGISGSGSPPPPPRPQPTSPPPAPAPVVPPVAEPAPIEVVPDAPAKAPTEPAPRAKAKPTRPKPRPARPAPQQNRPTPKPPAPAPEPAAPAPEPVTTTPEPAAPAPEPSKQPQEEIQTSDLRDPFGDLR